MKKPDILEQAIIDPITGKNITSEAFAESEKEMSDGISKVLEEAKQRKESEKASRSSHRRLVLRGE